MRWIYSLCLVAMATLPARADDPAPPPAPANPEVKVGLNNRIFIDSSDIYDPTYGLARVGIVNDNVVSFSPFRFLKELPPNGKPISRNFAVYTYNSEKNKSGNLKVPVIGGVSASGDDILHIVMEDISEVFLEKGYRPTVCEIFGALNSATVKPNSTVIFTDHAIFSTMSYGIASKQNADAKVGVGTFFSAGADTYKSADVTTKVPLISVNGVKFDVADPKKFCTRRGDRRLEVFTEFKSLQDLGLSDSTEIKTLNNLTE